MKFLFLFCFAIVFFSPYSYSVDILRPNQSLIDKGQILVSASKTFELGFFSPLNSTNRYIGIWYKKISGCVVVWVANRDNPVQDSSGVLSINPNGNILISNNQSRIVWSSNSSARNPILKLLDSGNLVVVNDNGIYAWQSFDLVGDTQIAGMKLGWDLKTGQNWYFTSWSSLNDPSTGSFKYELDPRLPQTIQSRGSQILYRTGPWDGVRFGGIPILGANAVYKPIFVFNETHVYYTFENPDKSSITRFWVNPSGSLNQLRWNPSNNDWISIFNLQNDECDNYGRCGRFGLCRSNQIPVCECPTGFVPKFLQNWASYDFSGGCVLRKQLNCSMEVGFKKFSNLKLPYGEFVVDRKIRKQDECKAACSSNCSCVAFTVARIVGCVLWFGELIDMRVFDQAGQDLYIKLAASELGKHNLPRV